MNKVTCTILRTRYGDMQIENDLASLIPEVSGVLQYRITKDAIGKFVSFQCTPVRDDGIVGDPRTCFGQERVRPGIVCSFSENCIYTYYIDVLLRLNFTVDPSFFIKE